MSQPAPTGTLYRCVFDRIGRNRGVEPATFLLPDLDALPEAVAGVRNAGTFVVMVQPTAQRDGLDVPV